MTKSKARANILFKKSIPRRTFLRGVGASIALPLLDSMVPALARAAERPAAQRLGFVYVPNGVIMDAWTPKTEGASFEITSALTPLAPYRDQLQVLTGLAHNNGKAIEGEGAGEHARASAVFLTGVHPHKTEGADLRAGISVDQIVARHMGNQTQLASLEVAVDSTDVIGTCDSGYSCAYSNTLSWRTATTPVPMENRPRRVFERLFGDAATTDSTERRAQLEKQRSILDLVADDVRRLLPGLGPTDRAKLSEYLESVRDIERRIAVAEQQSSRELPSFERPAGVPSVFSEHVKLMFDLQVLAWQTDMTRMITFMMGREQNTRSYKELGYAEAYHSLSHHQYDPVKIAKVQQIDLLHVKCLAYFIGKLKATPDGDGTLLDHSMIVYGGALSDGNLHVHNNLPILLLGGGAGRPGADKLRGGRHLRFPQDTPATNLFLAMLDKMGIPMDHLGDSTGKLDLLEGV
ncbi:MAG: DUF1552 domain-containing protein [Acidobacteria bacterium]|nr:DUF1552 domain-containing protein [Acidobacteriota bacterium]